MWQVTATTDDASFIDGLLDEIIHESAASLPLHEQRIGSVEVHWHQTEPKVAFVAANPEAGSFEDRRFAESIVMAQLEPFGYRRATIPMRWDHLNPKYADWNDVENKAKRLVQQGSVHINTNSYNLVRAVVQGDGTDNDGVPDKHQVELHRDDPNSQALTNQFCDCDWGKFMNTPRTREYKQFQNRSCSHCLATFWQSQATPLDEDRAPGDMGMPGQMSMPMGDIGPMQAPGSMGLMQNAPAQNLQQNPNMGMGAGGVPAPEDVLPPFPMANQPPVNPDSVPGLKPGPTPANPLQYPGQTYSHVSGLTPQEYTGDPGVDRLIEEFKFEHASKYPIATMDDPAKALDMCNLVSNAFAQWMQRHGYQTDWQNKGQQPPPQVTREWGFGKDLYPAQDTWPQGHEAPAASHRVNVVRTRNGDFIVDWSAAQYGQQHVPEVQPAGDLQLSDDPGIYSKVAVEQQYQNGDLVQLRYEDVGTWVGRSEEHGAGQPVTVPAGSVGEVLGTHPSTGMVNALFMGQFTEQNVALEPFGAVLWSFPSELVPRPDMKKPGPALKRR